VQQVTAGQGVDRDLGSLGQVVPEHDRAGLDAVRAGRRVRTSTLNTAPPFANCLDLPRRIS